MMKKCLFYAFCLFSCVATKAQIGINTKTPLGLFHIDPQKNTSVNGLANFSDDIIVTNNGNVGIGVINPTEKLEVAGDVLTTGNMILTDGAHTTEGNTSVIGKTVIKDASATVGTKSVVMDIVSSTPFSQSFRTGYRGNPGDGTKYLVAGDEKGVSTVGNLKFKPIILNGSTVINKQIGTNYDSYDNTKVVDYRYLDITDQPITLTKGKWLILAKVLAIGGPEVTFNDTGLYLKIYKTSPNSTTAAQFEADANTKGSANTLSISTAFPEVGGGCFAVAQIVYLAVVEEDMTIRLAAEYGTKWRKAYTAPGTSFLIDQTKNRMYLRAFLTNKDQNSTDRSHPVSKINPYFKAIKLDDNA